jgi:hypothetical protein
MIKLIWTKHAVQRGYGRLGRYGMDTLEKKILKNIDKATANKASNAALIPFKLGRQRCVAVATCQEEDGNNIIIKSMYPISIEKHRAIFSKKKR